MALFGNTKDWTAGEVERFLRQQGRTIHIDHKPYTYKIGKQFVVIRSLKGEKWVVGAWDIKGISPDDFERGRRKKTSYGMVTPSEIKQYLTNLLKGKE